ncbi:hypothetical protein J6Q66_00010 [bacterium]|nr:hypothetical protein [bacterium]
MSTNLCSTILFGLRNTDKTGKGDIGRLPVAVGQFTNAAKEVARLNSNVAQGMSAINTSSGFLSGAKKCAEFAGRNINPLICVAGGIKIATAKDKEKEFVNQTCALGLMFAGEKAYKALTDYETVKKVVKRLGQEENVAKLASSELVKNIRTNVGDKRLKVALNIAKGLGLFATSLGAYSIGEKLAKKTTGQKELAKSEKEYKELKNALQPQAQNTQLA